MGRCASHPGSGWTRNRRCHRGWWPRERFEWFATLVRLLALRSAPDMPARASAGLIVLLVCVALGIWVGVDWLANLPDPDFFVYGTTDISWYALMLLAIAAVLARRSVPAVDLGRVLSIALAGTAVLIVALFLIDRYLSSPWTLVASLLLFFYFILYAARSLRAISGRPQPAALVSGIAVAVGFLWATQWLYVDPSVWSARTTTTRRDMRVRGSSPSRCSSRSRSVSMRRSIGSPLRQALRRRYSSWDSPAMESSACLPRR